MSTADWISLVEASYDLEGSEEEWLNRMLTCAVPLMGGEGLHGAWSFDCSPTNFKFRKFAKQMSKSLVLTVRAGHALSSKRLFDLAYRSGRIIGTASETLSDYGDLQKQFMKIWGRFGKDTFSIGCLTGNNSGIALATLLPKNRALTPIEYKRWPKIAAHVGAGMRLRKCLIDSSLNNDSIEGVFLSNGKNIDAKGLVQESIVREQLRQAIKRVEIARTKSARADSDEALNTWQGLIEGRWSLVDRFDNDGKRFIVAVKNNLGHLDPRGLSQREREVAEYLGMGRAIKEIAYAFGVSQSAITNCIPRIQKKLGLTTLADLIQFFSPTGLRAKLVEKKIGNESILFGTTSELNKHRVYDLTDAEKEVLEHLIAGSTHADIAQRRSTSINTVSSQIQTIYQKLHVRSRSELAARLCS